MLHTTDSLHDVHDGSTVLHASGTLLCAANGDVSDVPVSNPMCAPSGSMLHDPLRSALRLPPGSGPVLPSHVRRPDGPHVRRPYVCRPGSAYRQRPRVTFGK